VKLADLLADLVGQLPEDRRKLMEALVKEFGVGDDFHFLLALVAGANKRQRHIVRLFLNGLESLEIAKENQKSK